MATLAAAIVAVILVNSLFSFWQERRAYRALEALQRLLPAAVPGCSIAKRGLFLPRVELFRSRVPSRT